MVASEARKNASEKIWNSLPGIIRRNIEEAVNEGKFECYISVQYLEPQGYFKNIKEYDEILSNFETLKELGYKPLTYIENGKCLITITW